MLVLLIERIIVRLLLTQTIKLQSLRKGSKQRLIIAKKSWTNTHPKTEFMIILKSFEI